MTDRRTLRNRPVDRAHALALSPSGFDPGNLGHLFTAGQVQEIASSDQLPGLIEAARETERAARSVRMWLASLVTDDDRRCRSCGNRIVGRADRVFCSAACRQAGHRAKGGEQHAR